MGTQSTWESCNTWASTQTPTLLSTSSMAGDDRDNSQDIEEEEQYIWKNGLVVKTKSQISVLTQKVEQFNVKICDVGGPEVTTSRNYLKDMRYLNAIGDNVNVRDLSDFLTICFCEYDSFFKDHREQITANSEQRRILLPLASDIVFNEIRRILDFITNNTVNYTM